MPRPLRQFGLRTLLIAVALTALVLGLWRSVIDPIHRQHVAVATLVDLGGRVEWRAGGPSWLRRSLGSYYVTQVEAVNLHRARIKDEDLKVLQDLPTVRRVYLSGTDVSREGLKHLQKLPRLERIALWRTSVTDADLKPLAEISTLQAIDLQETRTTERCLADLSRLDRLETLKFNFPVTDAGLQHLAQLSDLSLGPLQVNGLTERGAVLLPGLRMEHLDVRGPQGDGWATYLADHPTVTSFRLHNAELSEAELRAILAPNRLAALYLENVPLTDALLPLLAGCDQLEHVEFRETLTTPTEFLRHFGPGHQEVTIFRNWIRLSSWPSISWHGPLEGKAFDALQFCRQTERLIFSAGGLGDVDTAWLEKLHSLEEIELTFDLHDVDFRRMAALPKLTTLSIPVRLRHVTSQGIAELKHAELLRTLEIRGAGIGDEHLAALGTLRQLHVLRIPGNPITDEGIAHLTQLNQLRSLGISFCHEVGDGGLKHIAKLQRLEQLSAQGTQITDTGLLYLHTMPYLRHVSVLGSKHTREGLRELRKALPSGGGVIY